MTPHPHPGHVITSVRVVFIFLLLLLAAVKAASQTGGTLAEGPPKGSVRGAADAAPPQVGTQDDDAMFAPAPRFHRTCSAAAEGACGDAQKWAAEPKRKSTWAAARAAALPAPLASTTRKGGIVGGRAMGKEKRSVAYARLKRAAAASSAPEMDAAGWVGDGDPPGTPPHPRRCVVLTVADDWLATGAGSRLLDNHLCAIHAAGRGDASLVVTTTLAAARALVAAGYRAFYAAALVEGTAPGRERIDPSAAGLDRSLDADADGQPGQLSGGSPPLDVLELRAARELLALGYDVMLGAADGTAWTSDATRRAPTACGPNVDVCLLPPVERHAPTTGATGGWTPPDEGTEGVGKIGEAKGKKGAGAGSNLGLGGGASVGFMFARGNERSVAALDAALDLRSAAESPLKDATGRAALDRVLAALGTSAGTSAAPLGPPGVEHRYTREEEGEAASRTRRGRTSHRRLLLAALDEAGDEDEGGGERGSAAEEAEKEAAIRAGHAAVGDSVGHQDVRALMSRLHSRRREMEDEDEEDEERKEAERRRRREEAEEQRRKQAEEDERLEAERRERREKERQRRRVEAEARAERQRIEAEEAKKRREAEEEEAKKRREEDAARREAERKQREEEEAAAEKEKLMHGTLRWKHLDADVGVVAASAREGGGALRGAAEKMAALAEAGAWVCGDDPIPAASSQTKRPKKTPGREVEITGGDPLRDFLVAVERRKKRKSPAADVKGTPSDPTVEGEEGPKAEAEEDASGEEEGNASSGKKRRTKTQHESDACRAARDKANDAEQEGTEATRRYCHVDPVSEKETCYDAMRSVMNQKFVKPHRGTNRGKSGVLFCTGPTLDAYGEHRVADSQGKPVLSFGVNSIVLNKKLHMDYVFLQDRGKPTGDTGYLSNKEAVDGYEAGVRKFFGHYPGKKSFGPNGQHAKAANASRYQAHNSRPSCERTVVPLVADVGNFAFGGSCSTAFAALQFALYSGIERLYLVGCDVHGGYGAGAKNADVAPEKVPEHAARIISGWRVVPAFVKKHYPCATVTVVRPVALQGLGFREIDGDPDF